MDNMIVLTLIQSSAPLQESISRKEKKNIKEKKKEKESVPSAAKKKKETPHGAGFMGCTCELRYT